MSLIESLKQNFEAMETTPTYRAPQNLSQLQTLLRQACLTRNIHQDLPYYCNWYADYLANVHSQDNQGMSKTRGKARRMWAEQSLIYQDLIHLLKNLSTEMTGSSWEQLEEDTNTLFELIDEFSEAVQEMQEWVTNEETRCLKCGWNGSTAHCPHCQVQVLKPVRTFATHINNFVKLAPLQSNLFRSIMGVMEGERDVAVLRGPLQKLQERYLQSLKELEPVGHLAIAQAGTVNIENGLAGIAQIQRVFDDSDAQHLEDGWAMIFQADRDNLAAIESVTGNSVAVAAAYEIILDYVSLSNE